MLRALSGLENFSSNLDIYTSVQSAGSITSEEAPKHSIFIFKNSKFSAYGTSRPPEMESWLRD